MDTEGNCKLCERKSSFRCAHCPTVFYCSRDHQRQHWKMHKPECVPVKVKQSPVLGRYLEASRDLKAGDVIFREKPIIIAPKLSTIEHQPVCLGCHNELNERPTKCRNCELPLCSIKCANSQNHVPECHIIAQRGADKWHVDSIEHVSYGPFLLFRVLYHNRNNTKLWEKLQSLESHTEEMMKINKMKIIIEHSRLKEMFSEEEILRCCGIVQVNAYDISKYLAAVYDRASLLEHNCKPNCRTIFSSEGDIIVVADFDISAGSHLSVCYTNPLWGTEVRRRHLSSTRFFECSCERCSDPTEFGTMFSAVKCHDKLCKGYLLPETFLVHICDEPDNPRSPMFWICDICKLHVKEQVVKMWLKFISVENYMLKEGVEKIQHYISKNTKILHPDHYYITEARILLIMTIGRGERTRRNSNYTNSLKIIMIKQVLAVLNALTPTAINERAIMLYHASMTLFEIASGSLYIAPKPRLTLLSQLRHILKELVDLLRNLPEETYSWMLVKYARSASVELDDLAAELTVEQD